jgi:hypothetical protein
MNSVLLALAQHRAALAKAEMIVMRADDHIF